MVRRKLKPQIVVIPVREGSSPAKEEEEENRSTCCGVRTQNGEKFWLPEFQESPPGTPIPLSTDGMRDKWMKKTMSVAPVQEGPRFCLNVLRMASVDVITPPCTCPVCNIVHQTRQEAEKQGSDLDRQELIDHGLKRFTIYDKARPWIRQYVQGCTNPRPLARRMPEVKTGHSEVLYNVYRSKMLPPGKVIRDVKKNDTPKDFNSKTGAPRPRISSAPTIRSKFLQR